MKKNKLLTVAGSLVMASILSVPQAAYAFDMHSGMTCEAANLNQALQGIGKSQAGVKNNATIPLFVVCPLDRDVYDNVPGRVSVWATFPGSGTIECTARAQDLVTGAYVSKTFNVSSGEGSVSGPNRGAHFDTLAFTLNSGNLTLVCALDPGEGIELTYSLL